jgi:hypothetical protein
VTAQRSERTDLDVQWLSSERFTGGYMRRLSLGPDIDAEHIAATYQNGVLTVTFPVAARAKPRRIEITPGHVRKQRSSSPATHPTSRPRPNLSSPDGSRRVIRRALAFQQLIHGRVDAALRLGEPGAHRWRSLAEGIDFRITDDPFWPRLATHLDHAARARRRRRRTAHRLDRAPRAAARRTARGSAVVAVGRHTGTADPRGRQHRPATSMDA